MRAPALLIALLLVAAPAAANRLISANATVEIVDAVLTVTPAREWNRLSARPGRSAQTWTLDGDALNEVTFYAGIESERPIFREVDRRNRPLPRFSSTMLLTDVPTLLENSYRVGRGVSVFAMERVEPTRFGGQSGVRFHYSFTAEDEVRRRGEAVGAIFRGKLYLVAYEAPAIHYFDASVEDFRRLIASAMLR
jgi:hypothetical protein